MIIKNYGLHWKIGDVFWGIQKSSGSLLGVKPQAKGKSEEVDFREQTGIYVLYANYNIVYVGYAGGGNQTLLARLRQHCGDRLAGRWDQFSWFGTRRVIKTGLSQKVKVTSASRVTVLRQIEAVLIATVEPKLNLQRGSFGKNKVDQYLQRRDARLGNSVEEMIKEIWDKSQE